MTLKKRNYFFIAGIIISTLSLFFITALFITAALKNQVTPPRHAVRPFYFSLKSGFLFSQNFISVIVSIFIFSAYVPITLSIILRLFEKTQAMEIVFYAVFLLGCFMEQARMLMPLFDLWKTYTVLLNTIGRIVICGRMLAPLSLFFIPVFTELKHRQDFTQNIILAILIAVFTGLLMPLDASKTTSTCTVVWSYEEIFFAVRLLLFIASVICFKGKGNLVGYIILFAGYSCLCIADSIAVLSAGAVLLIAGTYRFIVAYHKMYLWR